MSGERNLSVPPFRAWPGRLEIPAADPRRSARFYAEVFGWTAQEALQWRGEPYVGVGTGQGGTGLGVTTPAALGSDAPLAVIHVEGSSLGAVLKRVEAAGGTVDLPPTPVDDLGTFARFRDPDGHLLGLWRGAGA